MHIERIDALYHDAAAARARYGALAARRAERFGAASNARYFSAPGRTEISGNHTDHNLGRVLAAAVTLDTAAAAVPTGDNVISVVSEGFTGSTVIELGDLGPRPEERYKTAALIRGVAAAMRARGHNVGGFNAAVASDVMVGSGISSSAAFEVLIVTILDGLYNGGTLAPLEKARIAKTAENDYFGKPSGLMDQTASAVGGLVMIDFAEETPLLTPVHYDFAKAGYGVAVIDSGSSHDDLTHEYAAIPADMHSVAAVYGQRALRAVDPAQFERDIPALRRSVPERAILRARHFFDENARVLAQAEALERGDIDAFLALTTQSGISSQTLLQNISVPGSPHQGLALALDAARRALGGRGAYRVHGGGFAGTILAFIPGDMREAFTAAMGALLGERAITPLGVRKQGACEVGIE